jgi:hypothetical protein
MRSLPKLIPGVHAKLPDGAQDEVKEIYAHTEEHHEELNLYIKGEGGEEDEGQAESQTGAEADDAPTPEAEIQPEPDEEGDR